MKYLWIVAALMSFGSLLQAPPAVAQTTSPARANAPLRYNLPLDQARVAKDCHYYGDRRAGRRR